MRKCLKRVEPNEYADTNTADGEQTATRLQTLDDLNRKSTYKVIENRQLIVLKPQHYQTTITVRGDTQRAHLRPIAI